MGGYCIARYLIARQTAKPSTFSEQSFVTRLFGEEFSERHPLAEDIVRSLAVLCPALLGQRLDKLVARDQAFSAAVEALFEGNPAKVGADDRMMVAKLFTAPKNRPWFGCTCSTPWPRTRHTRSTRHSCRSCLPRFLCASAILRGRSICARTLKDVGGGSAHSRVPRGRTSSVRRRSSRRPFFSSWRNTRSGCSPPPFVLCGTRPREPSTGSVPAPSRSSSELTSCRALVQ